MFTGIVQAQVQVRDLTKRDGFLRLTLDAGEAHLQQLQRGASIAVNGTCLTATEFDSAAGWVSFDVIDETLIKTNLGTLQPGSKVNFERSLKFGDEIGGHIVSGHISATAEILTIKRSDDNCAMQLSFPAELAPYIQPKGFIAIDGASLTIGAVEGHSFWLHLIPETLAITTLGQKQVGDRLNLEPATAQPVGVPSMPASGSSAGGDAGPV
jgi:riboflavin synthase